MTEIQMSALVQDVLDGEVEPIRARFLLKKELPESSKHLKQVNDYCDSIKPKAQWVRVGTSHNTPEYGKMYRGGAWEDTVYYYR